MEIGRQRLSCHMKELVSVKGTMHFPAHGLIGPASGNKYRS